MRNTQDHLSAIIISIKGEVRRTRTLVRDTLTTEQSKEREGQYLNGLRYALDRLNHAVGEVDQEHHEQFGSVMPRSLKEPEKLIP